METVLLTSFAVSCAYAALSVGLLWALLRLWNHLSGNQFDEAYARIMADPKAAALYCGLRFLGIGLLVALVLS